MLDAGKILFLDKGTYSATTTYEVLDTVMGSDNIRYFSKVNNNLGNPLSDNTKWAVLAYRGLPGSGDMDTSVYDTNSDGVVNAADKVGNAITSVLEGLSKDSTTGNLMFEGNPIKGGSDIEDITKADYDAKKTAGTLENDKYYAIIDDTEEGGGSGKVDGTTITKNSNNELTLSNGVKTKLNNFGSDNKLLDSALSSNTSDKLTKVGESDDWLKSKNLLYKSIVDYGKYYDENGELKEIFAWDLYHINVRGLDTISISGYGSDVTPTTAITYRWEDINKNPISSIPQSVIGNVNGIIVPSNAYYIGLPITIKFYESTYGSIDTVQVEESTIATTYQAPYKSNSELTEIISNSTDWLKGKVISTPAVTQGSIDSSSVTIRCAINTFIMVEPNRNYIFTSDSNVEFTVWYYSDTSTKIGASGWNGQNSFTTPSNCNYIKAMIRKSDDSNITPTDCGTVNFSYYNKSNAELTNLTNELSAINTYTIPYDTITPSGGATDYVFSTGTVTVPKGLYIIETGCDHWNSSASATLRCKVRANNVDYKIMDCLYDKAGHTYGVNTFMYIATTDTKLEISVASNITTNVTVKLTAYKIK